LKADLLPQTKYCGSISHRKETPTPITRYTLVTIIKNMYEYKKANNIKKIK
jgi:hypothetical protein